MLELLLESKEWIDNGLASVQVMLINNTLRQIFVNKITLIINKKIKIRKSLNESMNLCFGQTLTDFCVKSLVKAKHCH